MIDEKKIINEIKTGGGNAQNKSFGILYDFYYPELFHFIYRYLKSADLAREIAHDAFVRLWLHRQNLDPDRSVRAYLFTICRNSLIKEFRRQLRNPLMKDYFDFISGLSVEARISYDYDTYVKAIGQASSILSPRQREIFMLSRNEGLSAAEIAARLSIGEQVVRNQLSAALKKIRMELGRLI